MIYMYVDLLVSDWMSSEALMAFCAISALTVWYHLWMLSAVEDDNFALFNYINDQSNITEDLQTHVDNVSLWTPQTTLPDDFHKSLLLLLLAAKDSMWAT